MIRSRGFSLLEVMLALVVVAIGISVLLTFSASNQRETSNKATGNDYGLIVNDILVQFVNDNAACTDLATCLTACAGNTSCIAACNVACSALKPYAKETAYDYLCHNLTHSQNTCSNNKISAAQVTALQAAGINLTTTTISTTTKAGTKTTEDSTATITVNMSSKLSDQ